MGCYPADVTRNACYKPDQLPASLTGGGMHTTESCNGRQAGWVHGRAFGVLI